MRSYLAVALVILIISLAAIQPSMAFNTTAAPFITTDNTIFMFPVCPTGITITEFNSFSTARTDNETFNLNFPLFSDGIVAGPARGSLLAPGVALGTGASANVLPFGPVNLAFPSLAQTVNDTCSYQRTYFFTDVLG